MVNWKKIREQFPATRKYTYLNAAEGSPLSIKASREGRKFYEEMLSRGDLAWEEWLERKERIRDKIARFLNADRREIAFTLNTSAGMNMIARMLGRRGEVVTMEDEFPSSTLPWLNLNYRLHFVKSRNAIYHIGEIERKITKKTRILVTSHVQYKTGFRQDLVELGKMCARRKLTYVVNATQAMGAFPVDVKKARIDFLVFAGLKWLMAGYGIGVLYMNRKWLDEIDFPVAGWQSVRNPDKKENRRLDLRKEASALEVGCPHFPNIFALGGALDLISGIGIENIEERILELGDYLTMRLKPLGLEIVSPLQKQYRSGITIIGMEGAERIVKKLAARGIIISARGEGIRVSLHIYNDKKDIDRFVGELGKILGKKA